MSELDQTAWETFIISLVVFAGFITVMKGINYCHEKIRQRKQR